jgi:hypothetical protein
MDKHIATTIHVLLLCAIVTTTSRRVCITVTVQVVKGPHYTRTRTNNSYLERVRDKIIIILSETDAAAGDRFLLAAQRSD